MQKNFLAKNSSLTAFNLGYGEYQKKHENEFLKACEERNPKILPRDDDLKLELTTGGGTISGNGEKVSLHEMFLKNIA